MEITIEELVKILGTSSSVEKNNSVFTPGETIFIRTVTYHLTGKVIREMGGFLELEEVAWIADSGRFSEAFATGNLNEIEPVPGKVRVNILSIVDVFQWSHSLPRVTK